MSKYKLIRQDFTYRKNNISLNNSLYSNKKNKTGKATFYFTFPFYVIKYYVVQGVVIVVAVALDIRKYIAKK